MSPETLERLRIIASLLETQDNRITSDPIFMVQRRHRQIGMDTDYCELVGWHYAHESNSFVTLESDPERYNNLEHGKFGEDEEEEAWTRTGYVDWWENIQPFLTDQAAQEFCLMQRHHYPEGLRVFVESGYSNPEWQWLRVLVGGAAAEIKRLTEERDEARRGYHQLDLNWESVHERCMKSIREACADKDLTVPELARKVLIMRHHSEVTRRFVKSHAPDVANELSRCPGDIAEAFDRFLKEFDGEG